MAGPAAGDDIPEIGVGMLGYAFMGKAHSNAFRTTTRNLRDHGHNDFRLFASNGSFTAKAQKDIRKNLKLRKFRFY